MEKKELDAVIIVKLNAFLADRRAEDSPEDTTRGLTRFTRLGVINNTMPAFFRHVVAQLEKEEQNNAQDQR